MGSDVFYKRLCEVRKEKKLTQEDIALYLNIKRQTYGNYEKKDGSRPDIYTLVLISKYLNVSTDYLLGISDKKQIDLYEDVAYYEKTLLNLFRQFDDIKKGMALQRIMDLSKEEQAASQEYSLKNA